MKNVSDSLDDIISATENVDGRVIALTDLVEAMTRVQLSMYNKIEFLEKRIRLVEFVDDCQDKEIEILLANGGMDK